MPSLTLNLTTTDAYTDSVPVGTSTRLALAVDHDDVTYSWTTGALTLQWTVDEDRKVWVDFDPAIVLLAGVRGYPRVPVAGVLAVRLRCSIADTGADPSCRLDYLLT